eukprot:2752727-Amphidinium_carterae.1
MIPFTVALSSSCEGLHCSRGVLSLGRGQQNLKLKERKTDPTPLVQGDDQMHTTAGPPRSMTQRRHPLR